MSKYILRMDNGLIKDGRCKDEPRFEYLKGFGNYVDILTENKSEAKVFLEKDISEGEIKVFTRGWEFIKI